MPDNRNDLESIHAEYERTRAAIGQAQAGVLADSTTVTSKSREVSVTVDGRGELTGITFRTRSYRTMSPTELATLLVDTIRAARRESLGKVAAAFESLLPAGLPMVDMMSGPIDVDTMMSDAVAKITRERQRS